MSSTDTEKHTQVYCIDNSDDTEHNSLFRALSSKCRNPKSNIKYGKYAPNVIQNLIDQGAKYPSDRDILLGTLTYTIDNYQDNQIPINKKLSGQKRVEALYQIIYYVIEKYVIKHQIKCSSDAWYHGIQLIEDALYKFENKSHLLLLKLFDKFLELNISFNNSQTHMNTLSLFINHMNVNSQSVDTRAKLKSVLKKMINLGARPNETKNMNTLMYCISTGDIEIIKIIAPIIENIDVSASWCNPLQCAISTGKKHIVEEILLMGGRPFYTSGDISTIGLMGPLILNREIFNLLICAGAIIPFEMFDSNIFRFYRRFSEAASLINYIYNVFKYQNNEQTAMHQEIETVLTNGRNALINMANQRSEEYKEVLKLATITLIPGCCIDLIHEYYYKNKLCIKCPKN